MLFLAASAVHATAPVGATPGSFAVSPSGAATYSISIFVPPGTNGMQPQLSLNYNSQGGNGLLGMGWFIGGLSVIHRCGATIAIDGFNGGVNYDANDRFCLDGERLISIGGSEYRTQHESWQKIVASDATTNPASFTVYEKDGTIRYYGYYDATRDARIEAAPPNSNVVRFWALSKIQDRNGNYLAITYREDNTNGDYRPERIDYTGNAAAGVAPYNSVQFSYGGRADSESKYEGGSKISMPSALSAVRSYAGTTLVREYRLGYESPSLPTYRSRLSSITECDADGVCLAPTTFAWQDGGTGHNLKALDSASGGSGPYLADLDGDGRTDYVYIHSCTGAGMTECTHDVRLSTGDGFFTTAQWTGWNISDSGPYFVDLNGDGKIDYVTVSADGTHYVSLSTGSGYTNVIWQGHGLHEYGAHFSDLNGDGRADYVSWDSGTSPNITHYVSLSTGSGYDNVTWTGPNCHQFADLNGDGKEDCISIADVTGNQWVGLSTGSGYTVESWVGHGTATGMGPGGILLFQVADLNGDGKKDLVWEKGDSNGSQYVSLSTGRGYKNVEWWATGVQPDWDSTEKSYRVRYADMNGDGKSDAITIKGSTQYIAFSSAIGGGGYSGSETRSTAASASSKTYFSDFNGDGKADSLMVDANGVLWRYLTKGLFPDLLLSITNGLGAKVNVSYKPLTDGTVYGEDNTALYPYQDVQNATYVVSQSTQSNGIGGMNTTSYTYGGLKKHLTANASLGFQWMQMIDPAGLEHYTIFNQTLDGAEGTVC